MPWLLILLIIFSVAVVAFILFLVSMAYIERQEMHWLALNGTPIQARIRELHLLASASQPVPSTNETEEHHPQTTSVRHIVIAEWTDPETEEAYTFRSRPLKQLPEEYREGYLINVLIDTEHPARYALADDLRTYQDRHK
ncbi:hypothetical protein [Ktedonospora formicarum]|uniref:Uncharacterized protein n=1 Tax=Ktedonospora formicarum TaxID=2778364 RepID=A0A8J3HWW1_9CHLR|nr:hypothetical protein [Ktedonospora formicarum]GHO45254.1 hypothetical protein KSX_34170 [Ktedonospora formicarum]